MNLISLHMCCNCNTLDWILKRVSRVHSHVRWCKPRKKIRPHRETFANKREFHAMWRRLPRKVAQSETIQIIERNTRMLAKWTGGACLYIFSFILSIFQSFVLSCVVYFHTQHTYVFELKYVNVYVFVLYNDQCGRRFFGY